MAKLITTSFSKMIHSIVFLCSIAVLLPANGYSQEPQLCLDGFCVGQTIQDAQFDKVAWITPKKDYARDPCAGIGCLPENAFRGYANKDQVLLAEAVSWRYLGGYNMVTKANLDILRRYKYECNPSARSIGGQRRFFGAYLSIPSQYLTVVGLRLINGELTIYRIARQYPYHNQNELVSLAKEITSQYGSRILLYDGISSNAYSDVITQHKDGWFGRSTLLNPTDLSDLAAELVLIDPRTRTLLQPSSMPESGEIAPLAVTLSSSCTRTLPLQ